LMTRMRYPRPPTYTGGTKIARQGLAFSVPWPAYYCDSKPMQGVCDEPGA
jgi:hypothetical protein